MNEYLPLLMIFVFGALVTGGFIAVSHLIGPRKVLPEKSLAYECGVTAPGDARHRFSVKFYLVAMLFILFDVEVVFLYPWAVLFRESVQSGLGIFFLVEMFIFLGVLIAGLVYVYGHKAIEWK